MAKPEKAAQCKPQPQPELRVLATIPWASRTLGISAARVWGLVKRGILSPPKREGEDVVLDETEVTNLVGNLPSLPVKKPAREPTGDVYARVFSHLEAGKTLPQIVILEKVTPDFVRMAKAEYDAGFSQPNPLTIIDAKTRAGIERLRIRERIALTNRETVEERSRSREHSTFLKTEAEKSKRHSHNIFQIMQGKK